LIETFVGCPRANAAFREVVPAAVEQRGTAVLVCHLGGRM